MEQEEQEESEEHESDYQDEDFFQIPESVRTINEEKSMHSDGLRQDLSS